MPIKNRVKGRPIGVGAEGNEIIPLPQTHAQIRVNKLLGSNLLNGTPSSDCFCAFCFNYFVNKMILYSLNLVVSFSKNKSEKKEIRQIINNKHNFYYTESLYLPSVSYSLLCSDAALLRRSYEKLFWKYAANLQKNTQAEVWFQ